MGYYIGTSGYYEGDRAKLSDIECLKKPSEYYNYNDGEWVLDQEAVINEKLDAVMSAYEIDREKLNKAWLSALISDGPNEVSRQAILTAQMEALDAQLDADIEAIFIGK